MRERARTTMGRQSRVHRGSIASDGRKVRRGLWSPEEDEKLIQYISTYGHGCWSSVPRLADKDTSSVVSAVNVTPPDITWFMEFPHQHQHQHQQTKFAMPSEPPISSMPGLCEISDSGEVPLVQPYPMAHQLYDPQRSVNQIVHIDIAMGSSSMSSSSSNVVPYPGFPLSNHHPTSQWDQ
ncbi:Transcription factor MYB86 [Acorus calamus]|uniref:Transcription factor MYB86 n=1 Tax=Acorus calamus TaxID=4465 RepID=A0AAV9DCM8_ACOCL|nr:Transcription factor MYB86 [Acorus calamus]